MAYKACYPCTHTPVYSPLSLFSSHMAFRISPNNPGALLPKDLCSPFPLPDCSSSLVPTRHHHHTHLHQDCSNVILASTTCILCLSTHNAPNSCSILLSIANDIIYLFAKVIAYCLSPQFLAKRAGISVSSGSIQCISQVLRKCQVHGRYPCFHYYVNKLVKEVNIKKVKVHYSL